MKYICILSLLIATNLNFSMKPYTLNLTSKGLDFSQFPPAYAFEKIGFTKNDIEVIRRFNSLLPYKIMWYNMFTDLSEKSNAEQKKALNAYLKEQHKKSLTNLDKHHPFHRIILLANKEKLEALKFSF